MAADKTGAMLYTSNPSSQYFKTVDTTSPGAQVAKYCLKSYDRVARDRSVRSYTGNNDIPPYIPPASDEPRFYWMCGAAAVTSVNAEDRLAASALSASVTRNNELFPFVDGWIKVDINTSAGKGLPLIGAVFSKATSTSVSPGVSGNFGLLWPHRYTRPEN